MSDDVAAGATLAEQHLLAFCRRYPEVRIDLPWGHFAVKAGKKTFLFLSLGGERMTGSVKLASTATEALQLPFTALPSNGLGYHGWVSFDVDPADAPVALLKEWIDESYRAVALKRMVKRLPEVGYPTESLAD